LTSGMNEAFLEKAVGDELIAQESQSAAGVLQAATAQGIPLMYVDAEYLEPLADASLSDEAKARIVQAAQAGYGILTPERMVTWNGEQTTAWWQIDLQSGETIGVGEDGTHQFLVIFTAEARLFALVVQEVQALAELFTREQAWRVAYNLTKLSFVVEIELRWRLGGFTKPTQQLAQEALQATKSYMYNSGWELYKSLCVEEIGEASCDSLW
jgi:hypothetical protein